MHLTCARQREQLTADTVYLTNIINSRCKLHQLVWADVWTVGEAKVE